MRFRTLATPLLLDAKSFPEAIFFIVNRDEGISEDQKSRIEPKLLQVIPESSLKDLDWNFKFVLGLNNLYVRGISR